MPPQETDPDLPQSVHKYLAEVWVSGGLLQGQTSEGSSVCMGPFEGGCHSLHYLHLRLAPGKQQERDTAPPINRKLD